MLSGIAAERYRLVLEAHRLCFRMLPLRHPESKLVLGAFLDAARTCSVTTADLRGVLLEALTVLDPQTGGRLPNLVYWFLHDSRHRTEPLDAFRDALLDVIRYLGIADVCVQRAVARLESRFADPAYTEAAAAAEENMTPHAFATR